jgi:NADPH-dependent glutamate synthase beta subunit-like oxidoreductase
MGFRPTIFEMDPIPAGMLATGVPGYRLPRQLIEAEVAVIQAMGVEIRCNTQVGKDVSFADLRRAPDCRHTKSSCSPGNWERANPR